jgi:hypothetical protein
MNSGKVQQVQRLTVHEYQLSEIAVFLSAVAFLATEH